MQRVRKVDVSLTMTVHVSCSLNVFQLHTGSVRAQRKLQVQCGHSCLPFLPRKRSEGIRLQIDAAFCGV